MANDYLFSLAANLRLSGIETEAIEIALAFASGKGERNMKFDEGEAISIARVVGQMPISDVLKATSKCDTKNTAMKLVNELGYLSGAHRYQRQGEVVKAIQDDNERMKVASAQNEAATRWYQSRTLPRPVAVHDAERGSFAPGYERVQRYRMAGGKGPVFGPAID